VTGPVVVDADVLGRERTGDETYVRNLLRALPDAATDAGLAVAAVTRHPELVPDGVQAVPLATGSQELRMSWTLPRLLRRLGASLVHTQYAVPVRCPCPAVVTVHDVSFERDPTAMRARDRAVFRRVVPRAVRRARRVLTVSERSRADIVELYGVDPERVVVTPNGVDPAFHPGEAGERGYALSVGAIQPRKNQLAALAAAREAGLPLVVVGPTRDPALAEALRRDGAQLEGYVSIERLAELYRGAACLVQASSYEGFGLPVLEAMASGTPVVTVPDAALLEVAGGAAVVREVNALADGIRTALAEHDRLAWAGLERARAFSWQATAERTVAVYLEALRAGAR
jgi:glycosyltransferase involved in cell wall biosynthesis